MEDLARGERIKALRTARRLTQPAVVDLLRQKAGAQVVTLRGYQAWEGGGGIRWDNAKVLADVFDVDPEYVMSGRHELAETPDPFDGAPTSMEQRLARIERSIEEARGEREEQAAEVRRLLNEQSGLLELIREIVAGLGVPDGATIQDRLVQMLHDAAAQAGVPPAPARERQGRS